PAGPPEEHPPQRPLLRNRNLGLHRLGVRRLSPPSFGPKIRPSSPWSPRRRGGNPGREQRAGTGLPRLVGRLPSSFAVSPNSLALSHGSFGLSPISLELFPNSLGLSPGSGELSPSSLEGSPGSLEVSPISLKVSPPKPVKTNTRSHRTMFL